MIKPQPYNPLIANTFFRTGDIEAWGRGIDTIRNACRENGTDFPVFEFESTGMMVEFKGAIPSERKPERSGKVREKFGKDTGVAGTRWTADYSPTG